MSCVLRMFNRYITDKKLSKSWADDWFLMFQNIVETYGWHIASTMVAVCEIVLISANLRKIMLGNHYWYHVSDRKSENNYIYIYIKRIVQHVFWFNKRYVRELTGFFIPPLLLEMFKVVHCFGFRYCLSVDMIIVSYKKNSLVYSNYLDLLSIWPIQALHWRPQRSCCSSRSLWTLRNWSCKYT